MATPDISSLKLDDPGPNDALHSPAIPNDILHATDRYTEKLKAYAQSLPYSIEPNSKMQRLLDFFLLRISQCVEARDFEPGLIQWDSMLSYWGMMKYPIPKDKRIRLVKLYYHVATTPGMPSQAMAVCADGLANLARSKKKLSIEDMRLPWKPIFNILRKDLFLSRRQFEYSQLSWVMGYVASNSRRFFHPIAIDEMLNTFIPLMNGTDLDSLLSTQYYLLTFLPLSHPQSYLPMLCRLWESLNSYLYDERMLQFLSRLAELHVDPTVSDPKKIEEIPDDEKSDDEERPKWNRDDLDDSIPWSGIYKDVGIFTEHEWHFIMCKCLASMEIPLKDAGSLTTGPSADTASSFEIKRLPKPAWRIPSLAKIIVYSMAPDGAPSPSSTAPTPIFTPAGSGASTPALTAGSGVGDYLTIPLNRWGHSKAVTYLAGSKALDSLARLIASTEHFFHPTNSGAWTTDLTAFIKFIVYEFNKRWHEERQSDCKTPVARRLTDDMKRELVKSLRTVMLLAMFSQDTSTVSNVQSALKSMSYMEPALILQPILERAIPSLEALVETNRTLAVIKSLSAIAPAIVSRDVYYPGAKHLITILQLLIPGIDLNDPTKTLCTTSFLSEIAQYIAIGDISQTTGNQVSRPESPSVLQFDGTNGYTSLDGMEDLFLPELSRKEEDAILRETTGSFANWIESFIHRIIQLLENLPEEGANGNAGGASEVQVIDAVTGACSQICVHLSDALFNQVLDLIYDYASNNVRSNAVRAIHQLVECVANANPEKTLDKFFPMCVRNIQTEIEHGASSVRTTAAFSPIPSDATLHWNLAILRGSVYNDGRVLLKYKDEFLSLLHLLRNKTYSKRGYSWSGKLLSSALITLTHTYPIENKFVNPDEWKSEEFQRNHHKYWGKMYRTEDLKMSWHIPCKEELEFALQLFKELIEPNLTILDGLLENDKRDADWRNDFCRRLCFVTEAFAGIPTLCKEYISSEALRSMAETSDIRNELPEMIASVESLAAGFCLTDPNDGRYKYIRTLRHRFGTLLHKASVSLQKQGEENTVDAVQMLIGAIRTYLLDYGDSKDSYFVNSEQYSSELNVARLYAGQKVWPRPVLVRRARFYHSTRLYWNSVERLRGDLENTLIDDIVEWSLWHYPTVRGSSQALLDSLSSFYDGLRSRALPVLYSALRPGTDDGRMKGALYTLQYASLGRYAISEPATATEYIQHILDCHHNEKTSVQNVVSTVAESSLESFLEPSFLVYDVNNPSLDAALEELNGSLKVTPADIDLTNRVREQRIARIEAHNNSIESTRNLVLEIAGDSKTHWRYAIYAIRILRSLIRRDKPTSAPHLQLFAKMALDSNPSMRYYAHRGLMKMMRYIKHRTYSKGPGALTLADIDNPLKLRIAVEPSHELTVGVLTSYRSKAAVKQLSPKMVYYDQTPQGWLAWKTATVYNRPQADIDTFTWEEESQETIQCAKDAVLCEDFWKKLATHFSEENHESAVVQDHISLVKSIFQLLTDQPYEFLKPIVEELMADSDKNKQRAAAEFVAGLLNGSKHWRIEAQDRVWEWITPHFKKVLVPFMKSELLPIWTSFLDYLFYHKDPRRFQPLIDHVVNQFFNMDYNSQSSYDSVKVLALFRSFYSEAGWKFSDWSDSVLERFWPEIHSEHDDVRAYVAELMAFTGRLKWAPVPSAPTAQAFVVESRTTPLDHDLMGIRGTYHASRVNEVVEKFGEWREERIPGVRAFQSTYDRVGISVCRWLFQSVHDIQAVSTFDYILPLMPELFRFTEVNDNDELARRANVLLVRMCGVMPPRALVNPLLEAIFTAIQTSPSWKVRLKVLPILQVFYFRQLPVISEAKVVQILDVLCKCLDDEVVEVREMVGTTLSGILRLSPRRSVLTLKDRFVKLSQKSLIPPRTSATYSQAIRQRHAAIIGICALIDSYPYTIEKWMPELLTTVMLEHTHDPIPISTTIHKCASNFRKTHQDTWHEDSKRFTDHQLAALSTLLTGSSYYA